MTAEKCWKLTAEKCMFLLAFYNGYQEEAPIDASTLVLFRKRLKMDVITEANDYMLEAFKEKESQDKNDDDHTTPPSGGEGGESKAEPEQESENI